MSHKTYSPQFKKICELQIAANNTLNWLCQRKSAVLNNEPEFVFAPFCQQLAAAYVLYPHGEEQLEIMLPLFSPLPDAMYNPIRRLMRILQKGDGFFVDVVLYSSIATHEAVRYWSDVDVLAVLKKSVFADVGSFLSARKVLHEAEAALYEFDPWQHHGIQCVAEDDLHFYPEVYLPLDTIRRGASLLGGRNLVFACRESLAEKQMRFHRVLDLLERSAREGAMHHHGRDGVYLEESYVNTADNFYQLKYFISVVLLLPSLYIELVDAPVYKKDSFSRITEFFTEGELELVRACEKTRLLFDQIQSHQNEIPVEVKAILGSNYLTRGARLAVTMRHAYESHRSSH